jgi:hypothetical protein
MKKASFSATIYSPCGTKSASAYGSVTLKDDNKVSISIQCRNYLPYKLRSLATKTANDIVAADFNHPAIIGEVESSDTGILAILTKETFDLKQSLLCKTHTFANHQYAHIMESIPSVKSELDSVVSAYNEAIRNKDAAKHSLGAEYNKLANKLQKMRKIEKNGLTAFVEEAMKCAELHYTSSLSKLAIKITQKGMDMTNFKLVSGYVGINLEMTMTDGVKTIKAWTIWAAEDSTLVSPHYRYLVK